MVSIERVRALAAALPGVTEAPHFRLLSFRVRGKIFATLDLDEQRAMLKLPLDEQARAIATDPEAYEAVPGTWGQRGSTYARLRVVRAASFRAFLETAWRGVAGPRREPGAERRFAAFVAKFSPEIASLGRAARTKMRAFLPGAVEMVYDNYYALVIGFGPTQRP